MPSTKKTAEEVVEAAVESFDVAEWLSAATTPNDSITIYRDGEALQNLAKLEDYIQRMKSLSDEDHEDEVSAITDDPKGLDEKVEAEIKAMRDRLEKNSLNFHLVGLAPKEADLIDKKVAKEWKDREDEEGNKGRNHVDFAEALADSYLSRTIVDVTDPSGKSVKKSWSKEDVRMLRFDEETGRGLPGQEFGRLEKKCVELIYMRYDVDKIIDQDFS